MRIKFIHHASFIIFYKSEESNKVIYIDPYKISPKDNHKADYILITHEHFDHYNPENIKNISTDKTKIIIPDGMNTEFSNSHKIHTHDSISFGNLKIGTIPAYNIDKPFHVKGKGVGYIIDIFENNKHHTIYHAGDTDFTPEMKILKGIDYALIPVGGTYTMDEKDASMFVKTIKPKIVIPMHYGNKVGIGLSEKIDELQKTCTEEKIELKILRENEHIDIF